MYRGRPFLFSGLTWLIMMEIGLEGLFVLKYENIEIEIERYCNGFRALPSFIPYSWVSDHDWACLLYTSIEKDKVK